MRILYIDCFSGISGDMTLGAFLDLGVKEERLKEELKKLKLEGYFLEIKRQLKNGLMGTKVKVVIEEEHHHKHEEEHHHHEEHHHEEHHHHHEEHHHEEHHHEEGYHHKHGEHHHRSFKDIKEMIESSDLSEEVKALSKKIFYIVAEAEGKIHGKAIDEVHFHEVGAVDSIVDIVGAAICFCELKIDRVEATSLHTGTGTIKCQHGIIPIPAPATLEILKAYKIPFYSTGIRKELVTPTGAAIIAGLVDAFKPLTNEVELEAIGYGIGERELEIANMLRLSLVVPKKKVK